ncbi:class I SAM-dependent methyltransferase [Pseudonocardia humida]|uniref:Methyltransferase domain-containing protein n=1 Tax=Pseudonocardia humida TaxID=2800819 RepID=A0ABT0ZTP3_9PSEU|nr:class I SAM-dependent methyltransferase [Pseudonocardia humida]MCO1654096.1 methyltransferase domain-containing protein [Pseudonocardia humida]
MTEELTAFVQKGVGDVAAMVSGALVALGDRLGLYAAMADGEPVTAGELAGRTGTTERYVREWLAAQAAAGFLRYCGDGRYRLTAEGAVVLTDEDSPVCLVGAFQLALAAVQSVDRLAAAFRTGAGVGWGEHHHELYPGCERFFAPGYRNHLVASWIPALDGAERALRSGAAVADVGCGRGASTLLMARAYPASTVTGFDAHADSVRAARKAAADAGLAERARFEVATAADYPGRYDLVTFFDCLHDMGDPIGAARHARAALHPGGRLMVVEPMAGDRVEDNLHPVGAAYYGFSTLLCTPGALSQGAPDAPAALGAQAGEERLRDVLAEAGFGVVRRIAETPFTMVLEARV